MRVSRVEDLVVYQKALAAAEADCDLRDQLGNSSSRVPALIAEGFEQKSDRHESTTHLRVALSRRYVSAAEAARLGGDYDEIRRMLGGLIEHLERDDRQNRWDKSGRRPLRRS
jgi:hypothetical protein